MDSRYATAWLLVMALRISLCLLTWNEIEGLKIVLQKIPKDIFYELFALDGGSTDGTIQFLESAEIRVIPQIMPTYNAAYQQAMTNYRGDAIVFFHPKGSINPNQIISVINALESNIDLVIASRMLEGARDEQDDRIIRYRKWFNIALSLAASLRWNRAKLPRITDPLHGFRGCSRYFTDTLILRSSGVTADLEMVRHAYTSEASIREVAVIETEVVGRLTHFPAFKTGRQLVSYLLFAK